MEKIDGIAWGSAILIGEGLGMQLGLGVLVLGWGTWVLRAGKGSCYIDGGCLHFVPLIVHFTGLLKWTYLVVFLKPLWGEGVMWLVQVIGGVTEGDTFGSLPEPTWGGGGRDSQGIYVSVNHKVRYLKFQVAYESRIGGKWHP